MRGHDTSTLLLAAAALALAVPGCGSGPETRSTTVANPQVSFAQVAGGFAQPTHVTHAGDGTGRLFVTEKGGTVRVVDNGAVSPAPFLDITARVLSAGGERGLFCVAFPPGYALQGAFYVNYTRIPDGATVVSRFQVTADPGVADPASEQILLVVPQPFENHNGGQLAFGPDGFLYIGMGDGGSGGDPLGNGQNLGSLLGKILRIDVASPTPPYGIPPGNPFVGVAGAQPEIWAFGLRNPWRFSFDRQTGDLFIGDVGQNQYEEIDHEAAGGPGGLNYGWNVMEGSQCYGTVGCNMAGLTLPVATYDHSQGCSVTGGHVYRGASFPALAGTYLYGDYCSGRIFGLRMAGSGWVSEALADSGFLVSTFGESEEGELFVADFGGGGLYRVVAP